MADQSRPVTGYPPPPAAGYRTNATVYPYVTPPPYALHIQSNPYVSQLRATLYRFLKSLAKSILGGGIFILIIWQIGLALIAYPRFHVETLTVSNFSVSSWSAISGVWEVKSIVRNPNWKITIYCDHIQVALLYKLCSISEATLPPFLQGTKNKTTIRTRFTSSFASVYVDNDLTPQWSHGAIKFNVWMMVRVKPSVWGARWRKLRVFCPDLQIVIPSNSNGGTLVGGRRKCRVDSDLLFRHIRPPEVPTCAWALWN